MDLPLRLRCYDASERSFYGGELSIENGRVRLARVPESLVDTDFYISPGWVDMHTHIYDGYGIFGLNAVSIGHCFGVHILSDAGSCGTASLYGFKNYILPTYQGITKVKLWLNISSIGLPSNHETIDFSLLNPVETANVASEHRDLICGIKVRLNNDLPPEHCLEPLELALQACELSGLPLMVHISAGPPNCADILPRLRKGDIVTHIFNGKPGSPWMPDGSPSLELAAADKRGVLFDVGHGYTSFNLEVCRRAIEHGFNTFTISSDLHKKCMALRPITFCEVMNKLYACGLPMEDILFDITKRSSDLLGFPHWCEGENLSLNATIFRFSPNTGDTPLYDCFGNTAIPEMLFTPLAIISDGVFAEI